jgi:hypothetical protein
MIFPPLFAQKPNKHVFFLHGLSSSTARDVPIDQSAVGRLLQLGFLSPHLMTHHFIV